MSETNQPSQEMSKMQQLAKQRYECLFKVQKIISQGEKYNLDKKDITKALKGLVESSLLFEGMLQLYAQDMFRMADAIGQSTSNMFTNSAVTKALIKTLVQKGITTEEELKKITEEEVLPEMIAEFEKGREEVKSEGVEEVNGERTE